MRVRALEVLALVGVLPVVPRLQLRDGVVVLRDAGRRRRPASGCEERGMRRGDSMGDEKDKNRASHGGAARSRVWSGGLRQARR